MCVLEHSGKSVEGGLSDVQGSGLSILSQRTQNQSGVHIRVTEDVDRADRYGLAVTLSTSQGP